MLIVFFGPPGAFSTGSYLRLVCVSSLCDESPGVYPGVCIDRSCCRFVAFFVVVSGWRRFFGFMASTGGTNKVSHYDNPVHDFFPSTRDVMPDFKQSAMIVILSTFRPSYAAMTKLVQYYGMA